LEGYAPFLEPALGLAGVIAIPAAENLNVHVMSPPLLSEKFFHVFRQRGIMAAHETKQTED
jgi:hypothetical protein